jgi:pimeloyl-ACP methyl ester carboxylesterase
LPRYWEVSEGVVTLIPERSTAGRRVRARSTAAPGAASPRWSGGDLTGGPLEGRVLPLDRSGDHAAEEHAERPGAAAEDGLADRSLREIAASAGTSHRMLLYHFGSREGLLAAIVSAIEARQRAAMADMSGGSPHEVMTGLWERVSSAELRPTRRTSSSPASSKEPSAGTPERPAAAPCHNSAGSVVLSAPDDKPDERQDVMELAFTRCGTGPPLVLLHGIGSSRQAWGPVVDALAERFDVLAIDLPGFGESAPLPADVEPLPAVIAASVAAFLDSQGVKAPHVAGNSLGGWVALELAAVRPLRSLTLLSPAGLWRDRTPLYNRISLRTTRWLAKHFTGLACRLVRYRAGRIVILGQTHGQPSRMSPAYARGAVRAMGTCPGFEATMKATEPRCYRAGPPIDAPVTVAFGSRDRLLRPRESRHLGELPPGTRVERLPGCGHVPMADDPGAVTALIVAGADRARPVRGRPA